MRKLLIIVLAAALSGCSENPVAIEDAEEIDINGEWEELVEVENPIRSREIFTLDLTSHDDFSVSGTVIKAISDFGISHSYNIIRTESFYMDGKIEIRYGTPAVLRGTTHYRSDNRGREYPVMIIVGNDEMITFLKSE